MCLSLVISVETGQLFEAFVAEFLCVFLLTRFKMDLDADSRCASNSSSDGRFWICFFCKALWHLVLQTYSWNIILSVYYPTYRYKYIFYKLISAGQFIYLSTVSTHYSFTMYIRMNIHFLFCLSVVSCQTVWSEHSAHYVAFSILCCDVCALYCCPVCPMFYVSCSSFSVYCDMVEMTIQPLDLSFVHCKWCSSSKCCSCHGVQVYLKPRKSQVVCHMSLCPHVCLRWPSVWLLITYFTC